MGDTEGVPETDVAAEAAARLATMERAAHMLGGGRVEEARRLLSVYLFGTNAGREMPRVYERNIEWVDRHNKRWHRKVFYRRYGYWPRERRR